MSEDTKKKKTRDYGPWKAFRVCDDGAWRELKNEQGFQPTHKDRDACRSWAASLLSVPAGTRVKLVRIKETFVVEEQLQPRRKIRVVG